MTSYYVRLAWISLRRTPILSSLVTLALALGIGVAMTTFSVYDLMARNPLPDEEGRLFAVQLNDWQEGLSADSSKPGEPGDKLTFRDAETLWRQARAPRQSLSYPTQFNVFDPSGRDPRASPIWTRVTTGDFFAQFHAPFLYGAAWSRADDIAGRPLVVLSRELNQRLFGGANSVGRQLRVDTLAGQSELTVVGVLSDWRLTPRVYDLHNGRFSDTDEAYISFSLTRPLKLPLMGGRNCWNDPAPGFEGELASDCIWVEYWASLPEAADLSAYRDYLAGYVAQGKAKGRFHQEHPWRLRSLSDQLRFERVVSADNRLLAVLGFAFLGVALVNALGLMLTQGLARAPELALRRALGASRGALFRQQLTEAGLVGLVAASVGLGLTLAGLQLVRRLYSNFGHLTHLDGRLLAATLVIGVLAALLAGLWPAWRASRVTPAAHLNLQ